MEKKFIINGKEILVKDFHHLGDAVSFTLEGRRYHFHLEQKNDHEFTFFGNSKIKANVSKPDSSNESMIFLNGKEALVNEFSVRVGKTKGLVGGLKSPMPGKIYKVLKPAGSKVSKGETILILEAMKMEHSIRADQDGVVKKIHFKEGELVQGGVVLAQLE